MNRSYYSLVLKIFLEILRIGADVNAVAKYDMMPLNIAEINVPSSKHHTTIVELLKTRGARSTWRRNCEGCYDDIHGSKAIHSITTVLNDSMAENYSKVAYSTSSSDFEKIEIDGDSSKFPEMIINQQICDNNNVFSTINFSEPNH